jgi:hypothetical protein
VELKALGCILRKRSIAIKERDRIESHRRSSRRAAKANRHPRGNEVNSRSIASEGEAIVARLFACIITVLALLGISPVTTSAQSLSAEGQKPGLKVEIRELKRDDGGMVTLRFQISNDSDGDFSACSLRESGSDPCNSLTGVHLIDAANKKKYLVVRDSAKKCVCAALDNVRKGSKANLWAKFPAPPDNVQKMTVVVPQFEPIENVPVSR